MHQYYKLDKIALKNLIRNNVSPTDLNNKIKRIIFYPKFNTTNLVFSNNFSSSTSHLSTTRGCPRGVMVQAMDFRIVVSEFVLQSRYYVHLGKVWTPLSSQLWVK